MLSQASKSILIRNVSSSLSYSTSQSLLITSSSLSSQMIKNKLSFSSSSSTAAAPEAARTAEPRNKLSQLKASIIFSNQKQQQQPKQENLLKESSLRNIEIPKSDQQKQQQTAQQVPQQQTKTEPPKAPSLVSKKKDLIEITDTAANRVKYLLQSKPDAIGVILGVKRRGCNGLSYTLDYKYDPAKSATGTAKADGSTGLKAKKKFSSLLEDKVEKNGVTVYIEPKSLLHIIGTRMDYVENEIKSGFEFSNPNSKGSCGCGESFNV